MDLAHARSLLPQNLRPIHQPHRPDRDAAALHALACRFTRFSPIVAVDSPGGLLIDATGTERIYKGESNLLHALMKEARHLSLRIRVAAASSCACAWAVARYGSSLPACVPPGEERRTLSELPVAALNPEPGVIESLAELGITAIRDLLALPRSELPARYGPQLLLRIDQALGHAMEHIEPVRPMPPPRVELRFDGPTTDWASVEAACRQVVSEMASLLAARHRGVRRLLLEFIRPHAPTEQLVTTLSMPSAKASHLWSLARTALDRVDLQQGVEGIAAEAAATSPLRSIQTTLDAAGHASGASSATLLGELLDSLVSRLGSDNVVRFQPVESHLPERAFRERTVLDPLQRDVAGVAAADRPSRLLSCPEPLDAIALTPDGPVHSVRWRGQQTRIISCSSPERLGPEWWQWRSAQRLPPDRDYFSVQTETGRRLWICRQAGTTNWFVHGEWG